MIRTLLITTALATLGLVSAANAGTVTVSLASGNDEAFNNNSVGSMTGDSVAVYNGVLGAISFAAGVDTSGVTIGTSGSAAEPLGDSSNYLWGLRAGTTVTFDNGPATSFLIHWGSVDAIAGDTYDNILTLSNGDTVTGTELVNLGLALGTGSQTSPDDNPWLLISDTEAFKSFTATSAQNAFEFDMAGAPELSTWAMMGLGFAALGYAGFRRSAKTRAAIA